MHSQIKRQWLSILSGIFIVLSTAHASVSEAAAGKEKLATPGLAQVPSWSQADLDFFLHGSMGTEVIPEAVLRAFIKIYPELFPTADLSHLGLIPDPDFGWQIGLSRTEVKHLGGLPSVGVNCASCHVAQITTATGGEPIRILGATSHFDAEAFFGSVLVATFKTSEATNMKKFLAVYLGVDPDVFESAGVSSPALKMLAIGDRHQASKKARISLANFGPMPASSCLK